MIDGVIDMVDSLAVFCDIGGHLPQIFIPAVALLAHLPQLFYILLEGCLQQSVNIAVVVIKSIPADPTLGRDIPDGNTFQRVLFQKAVKGINDRNWAIPFTILVRWLQLSYYFCFPVNAGTRLLIAIPKAPGPT